MEHQKKITHRLTLPFLLRINRKLSTQLAKLQSKEVASRSGSRGTAAIELIQAQISDCKTARSEIIGRIVERQKCAATEQERSNESHADSLPSG